MELLQHHAVSMALGIVWIAGILCGWGLRGLNEARRTRQLVPKTVDQLLTHFGHPPLKRERNDHARVL